MVLRDLVPPAGLAGHHPALRLEMGVDLQERQVAVDVRIHDRDAFWVWRRNAALSISMSPPGAALVT
jgi:hypothetical protein